MRIRNDPGKIFVRLPIIHQFNLVVPFPQNTSVRVKYM
jgi:hypothetical protein